MKKQVSYIVFLFVCFCLCIVGYCATRINGVESSQVTQLNNQRRLTDGTQTLDLDDETSAAPAIDILHYKTHKKEAYSVAVLSLDVADNGTLGVTFNPGTDEFHLSPVSVTASGKSAFWIYEGVITNTNAGTLLTVFNKYRDATNTTTLAAYSGQTVTNLGTCIRPGSIPGGTRQQAIGSSQSSRDEIVLKTNTVYYLVITNFSGGAADLSISLEGYIE